MHGDRYGYSLLPEKFRVDCEIPIICSEHGIFYQRAYNHYGIGSGCPKCAAKQTSINLTKGLSYHLKKINQIHDNEYFYHLIADNVKITDRVKILCSTHGEFEQTLANHKKGTSCPKCEIESRGIHSKKSLSENIKKSKEVHGEKYDYSKISESDLSTDHILIKCPVHGGFYQVMDAHRAGCGCPDCNIITSKGEKSLRNFIKEFYKDYVEYNNRSKLNGLELDIYFPIINKAIEFNGLYYHSEKFSNNYKHKNKLDMCNAQNLKLLTIFEDEWIFKQDIVKSKIKYFLGLDDRSKIYARKTGVIPLINKKTKKEFLNKYHIQGNCNSTIDLCLIDELGNVCAVGCFLMNGKEWVLNRYATSMNVVGGLGKIIKAFKDQVKPNRLVSFADLRWSDGDLYKKTGWENEAFLNPDYYYIEGKRKFHKSSYRHASLKNKLENYDENKTEHQNCFDNKIYRIYDCGKIRFTLKGL